METRRIHRQGPEHRAKTVGVFHVEIGMFGQGVGNACRLFGGGNGHLKPEPFVDHQPVMRPLIIKRRQFFAAGFSVQQTGKGAELPSHIVSRTILRPRLIAAIQPRQQ